MEIINLIVVHLVLARDTGEVVEGQGKEVADETKSPKFVFCHLELVPSLRLLSQSPPHPVGSCFH